MTATLTTASTLMCPHGGSVQFVPANTRARGDGMLLTTSDTVTITGCAFTLPNGQPSPCMSVTWLVSDIQVRAGAATLSSSASGLCVTAAQVPQGPVQVTATQTRISTR
jgi:hypothetical protein